jgi:hypothetical protein
VSAVRVSVVVNVSLSMIEATAHLEPGQTLELIPKDAPASAQPKPGKVSLPVYTTCIECGQEFNYKHAKDMHECPGERRTPKPNGHDREDRSLMGSGAAAAIAEGDE